MRLGRTALRLVVTAGLLLAQDVEAAPRAQGAPAREARPLVVRVGQAEGLTHIDFPQEPPRGFRTEKGELVLDFPRASVSPDTARLVADPIRLVSKASAAETPRGLEVRLTPAEGVTSKLERMDGVPTLVLHAPPVSGPKDQPAAPRGDPTPAIGRVRVFAEPRDGALRLHFPWRGPPGAAVFRRGDAVWAVFDVRAPLDLTALAPKTPFYERPEALYGAGWCALRLTVPAGLPVAASSEFGQWTLSLGRAAAPPAEPVAFARDLAAAAPALKVPLAGATGIYWIRDPDVGDRIAAVTALPPAKGFAEGRTLVDARFLASAQGLAVVPFVDDLTLATDADVVRIGRPGGMELSGAPLPDAKAPNAALALESPKPAATPALVDFAGWSNTGGASFLARYDELQRRASEEMAKGKNAPVADRMALARFLIGSELSFEALGVLALAERADGALSGKPEFRGLRGAARAMAGRFKDAEADFSSPALAGDPASALWRAYVDERLGDHQGARQEFASGRPALARFPDRWRGRFIRADAEAAIETGDAAGASQDLGLAQGLRLEREDEDALRLVHGRVAEARGAADQALADYDAAAASSYGGVSTPATLRAVELRLAANKMAQKDAEPLLASLRYRWRGDAVELDVARALGKLYLEAGRYRDALQVLRAANGRLPDLQASIGISQDLNAIFKALFLDGQADGLQPVQALALFYDFKDLTPVGADGDAMVRKLARRLVDVDLLDQASDLLKYQADNRLDGLPRAEVDTDLAMIELMNRRPEEALDALNASRTTLLPTALNQRRRLIEARAQTELGRYDAGVELLIGQKGAEADQLRGDIAWKTKDWPKAGALIEAGLGDRWRNPAPLDPAEQSQLVRAGAAYSLAGDDKSLARLRQRYGRLAEQSAAPNLLKIALDGVDQGKVSAEDFRRLAGDAAQFEGWIEVMKRRFASEPAPISGSAAAQKTQEPRSPRRA